MGKTRKYDVNKSGYRIRHRFDFMRIDDSKARRTRAIKRMHDDKKAWLLDIDEASYGVESPRYPQDAPWYPYIDMDDCPRFSTCWNCLRELCPVVENAKIIMELLGETEGISYP